MKRAPPQKLFGGPKRSPEEAAAALSAFLADPGQALDPGLQQLEALYERKVSVVREQLARAERQRDDAICERDLVERKYKEQLLEAHENARASLQEQAHTHAEEKASLESYAEYVKKHYETASGQVADEHSLEVAKLHAKVEELTRSQVDKSQLEARTKQIIKLKRDLEVLQGELQNQKQEFLSQMADKETLMKEKITSATKNLVEDNKALVDKLNDKTMECVRLAKELERVSGERNVLSYQLAESKEKLGPLERTIAMLEDQSDAYETERLKNKDTIAELKRRVSEQTTRAKVAQKESQQLRRTVAQRDKFIFAFSHEIYDLVYGDEKDNENHLKQRVLSLYDRFVKGTDHEESFRNPDKTVLDEQVAPFLTNASLPTLEFSRQRKTMQQVARCLSRNAKRAEAKLDEHRKVANMENSRLLVENKSLRQRVAELEKQQAALTATLELGHFRNARAPRTTPEKQRTRAAPGANTAQTDDAAGAVRAEAAALAQRRPHTSGPPPATRQTRSLRTEQALRATLRPRR